MALVEPCGGGHQFHRRDAERFEVRDDGGGGEAGEGAAFFRRHGGVRACVAGDVEFVEDGCADLRVRLLQRHGRTPRASALILQPAANLGSNR